MASQHQASYLCKIYDFLLLLSCVLIGPICSSAFPLHIKNDPIGSVYHFTVADLDRSLEVCRVCAVINGNIVIIVTKGVLVLPILSS